MRGTQPRPQPLRWQWHRGGCPLAGVSSAALQRQPRGVDGAESGFWQHRPEPAVLVAGWGQPEGAAESCPWPGCWLTEEAATVLNSDFKL